MYNVSGMNTYNSAVMINMYNSAVMINLYYLSLMLQVWYKVWTYFVFEISVLYIIQYTVQLEQAKEEEGGVDNTPKQVLTGGMLLTLYVQLL